MGFLSQLEDVLRPAARRYLGSDIVALRVAASYACRSRNSKSGARLSEHGRANAIDISRFTLAERRQFTCRSSRIRRGFGPVPSELPTPKSRESGSEQQDGRRSIRRAAALRERRYISVVRRTEFGLLVRAMAVARRCGIGRGRSRISVNPSNSPARPAATAGWARPTSCFSATLR